MALRIAWDARLGAASAGEALCGADGAGEGRRGTETTGDSHPGPNILGKDCPGVDGAGEHLCYCGKITHDARLGAASAAEALCRANGVREGRRGLTTTGDSRPGPDVLGTRLPRRRWCRGRPLLRRRRHTQCSSRRRERGARSLRCRWHGLTAAKSHAMLVSVPRARGRLFVALRAREGRRGLATTGDSRPGPNVLGTRLPRR